MQRIWIIGSPGAGKTTFANIMGRKLNIPVYHNDRIFWKENWRERPANEQIETTKKIAANDKWIYEGNRFDHCQIDGRFNRCDTIIFLSVNRFTCLYRFIRRYHTYKGTVRPDIADGCIEKIDINIVKYILFEYPKKNSLRQELVTEAMTANKRVIILNGSKSIKLWLETL